MPASAPRRALQGCVRIRVAIGALTGTVAVAMGAAVAAPAPPVCPVGTTPLRGAGEPPSIRVALNVQNTNIVARDAATGRRVGVPLELSRALAACLGAEVRFVDYQSVGAILDDAAKDVWDIAFVAADQSRAALAFTAPYMLVENTYLVPAASTIRDLADVDRDGRRIAVPARSAPDAVLTRTLTHATLVRGATGEAAFRIVADGGADALAADRSGLDAMARRLPGSRVLDGSFLEVPHAIAVADPSRVGADDVRAFVLCTVRTDFVARRIEEIGIRGVRPAPAAARSEPPACTPPLRSAEAPG